MSVHLIHLFAPRETGKRGSSTHPCYKRYWCIGCYNRHLSSIVKPGKALLTYRCNATGSLAACDANRTDGVAMHGQTRSVQQSQLRVMTGILSGRLKPKVPKLGHAHSSGSTNIGEATLFSQTKVQKVSHCRVEPTPRLATLPFSSHPSWCFACVVFLLSGVMVVIALATRESHGDGVVRDAVGAISTARGGTNLGFTDNAAIILDNPAGMVNACDCWLLGVGRRHRHLRLALLRSGQRRR